MSVALVDNVVSRWRAEHVAAIALSSETQIPLISPHLLPPAWPGLDLWDSWQVQHADGQTARFDGWSIWMILSAPTLPDPDLRHGVARIRLMMEQDGVWRDCGNVLPEGLNPGSREWSGSCVLEPETGALTLFYTVAGYQGEAQPSFAQRLFQTRGHLVVENGLARTHGWTNPVESVASDGRDYIIVTQKEGRPGFIKGFRDPGFFRDPATGRDYLLFTASLAQSASEWNGCIGLAQADAADWSGWSLLPPLLTADGLNNEQERPHIIYRNGLYYLFWSTQRRVFADGAPNGPNGLYGAVASSLFGPYEPLNGSGLVAANPDAQPFQGYSWWVEQDLRVASFVDLLDATAKDVVDVAGWRRDHFGGVPAPFFRIGLDGTRAWVEV